MMKFKTCIVLAGALHLFHVYATNSPSDVKSAIMTLEERLPGDIVTCRVSGLLPHVMIVSDQVGTNGVPLVIHNIGRGTKEDAYLLSNKIEGHFRCR